MSRIRVLGLVWLGLILLLGLEIGLAHLKLGHALAAIILLPAATMIALVVTFCMHIGRASAVARVFALAGVFWLIVLLGLGSIDSFTRTDYPVRITTYP